MFKRGERGLCLAREVADVADCAELGARRTLLYVGSALRGMIQEVVNSKGTL